VAAHGWRVWRQWRRRRQANQAWRRRRESESNGVAAKILAALAAAYGWRRWRGPMLMASSANLMA